MRSGFVAVVGRPNVGKSTLVNRMVGAKVSIVTEKAGTTRNRIMGIVNGDDYQLVLVDTPGLQHLKNRLGEEMMRGTRRSMDDADWTIHVVAVDEEARRWDETLVGQLPANTVLVLNRRDLAPTLEHAAAYEARFPYRAVFATSAVTGEGVMELIDFLAQHMPQGPAYFPVDAFSNQEDEALVAELIREQILFLTSEEIPHAVLVVVEPLRTRENGLMDVVATLYVERESQKGILIGKKGQMLKQIGTQARLEIERIYGTKVHLKLWVKVKEGWRDQENLLRRHGLSSK